MWKIYGLGEKIMWKKEDNKKQKIPSYLPDTTSFKWKVKVFFGKIFRPSQYNGTIEQEQKNNRRKNKNSSYSSSNKTKSNFSFRGEFDLVRFLWVVIPTILLITISILSACNLIIPAFENLEDAMLDMINNAEFMYLTIRLWEWLTGLLNDHVLLAILLGLFILAAILVLIILEGILFILFWILYIIIFLLFVLIGNISMIVLPLAMCVFIVIMSVKAFNDGENQIPSASCIILSFISLIIYYITFFTNY